MKKKLVLLVLSITFLFTPNVVSANENNVPFSINPILPDNQINEDVSYFDIGVEPGQDQKLELVIYNSSDETIDLKVTNNFAATSSNGLITYDGNIKEYDDSMLYPFNEISEIESENIEVKAGEQEVIEVEIHMPEDSFDGEILGGIHVIQEVDEAASESGVQILNQYAYAIAVRITEEGNSNEIEPIIELNSVEPGVINHRTGLQTEFANKTSTLIQPLKFSGQVFEDGSKTPLYTSTIEDFSIAPNAIFNFPIMYDNKPLKTGNYTFKAQVSNEEISFEFEENFEVTESVADEANEEAVEVAEEENNWMIYLVVGLAVIIILLIVILLLVVKRKK